jgi:hypothetical protein
MANNMTTVSGTGVPTDANVGNYAENADDLEDINTAARYADISHKWAVSEELVDDGTNPLDDSSRTWAERSKDEADRAQEVADGIQDVADDADRAEAAALEAEASAAAAAEDAEQTAIDAANTAEDAIETDEDATSAEEDALRAELAADRAEAAGAGSTGVIGEMKWFPTDHTNPTIRSGYVMPLGQELLRAGEYAALWAEVLQGRLPSVTELEWQAGQSGVYSDGDGATTFRMPNMAGQFLRIAGNADPDFATRLIGEIQVDEVGGHEHVTTNTLAAASTFLGDLFTPTALSTFVGAALGTHTHTSAAHNHANTVDASGLAFTGNAMADHGHGGSFITGGVAKNLSLDNISNYVGTGNGGVGAASAGTPTGNITGAAAMNNVASSAIIDAVAAGTPTGTVSTTIDAATPTGTVSTTIDAATPTGSVTTTISGDVAVAPSTGAETRPTNMYIQPYIVYAAAQEVAGLQIRGIWDVPNNVIVGDTLNFSIVKDVAPVAPEGGFTNGIAYKVVVGGDFDLNNDPTLETLNVGDYVVWYGSEWIQLASQPVTSVNTFTGDVVIHGENANIDDVTPTTIKAYIDAAIAGISTEGIKVGGLYLSMNATTPDVDLGYGTWALISGDATLSFGDGTVRDGIASGSNTPVVPLPEHSHTSASHAHANTVADTLAAPAHSHSTPAHSHSLGSKPARKGTWGAWNDSSGSWAIFGSGAYGDGGGISTDSGGSSTSGGASATALSGSVTIANVGASAVIDNAGTAGAALDVRGSRISINVYKRTS